MMLLRFGKSLVIKRALVILTIFGPRSSQPFDRKELDIYERNNYTFNFLSNPNEASGFTIKTSGCSISKMNVLDDSIKKLVHYPKHLTSCSKNQHPLLRSNETHIWTVKENFKYYRIRNESTFYCCYRAFYRPLSLASLPLGISDYQINYLDCIKFQESILATNEFVKVLCYYDAKVIHDHSFVFVPKKPFTVNREEPFKITGNSYNIIVMGISSMSRINFHRAMPNTYNLLAELKVIELFGYHKIADGTFNNIIPILTGMSSSELHAICWLKSKPTFDNCPFIWERFKDVGYYTALLEDTTKSGLFNSGMIDFMGRPTDYYLHPFIYEYKHITELSEHIKTKPRFLRKKLKLKPDKSMCMGDKYYYRLLLEYVERLTTVLKSNKLFGFFWESSMSPYSINAPMLMDHGYETLIRKLYDNGYLNETILIMLSDEGITSGDIRQTKEGQLEQRLPLAAIVVPPDFSVKYRLAYENLLKNRNRLTNPFDLHETLIDLIDLTAVKSNELVQRMNNKLIHERGTSLFLPIPSNRTCYSAGISNRLCTCQNTKKIYHNNKLVKAAVKFLVNYLNSLLMLYPQCEHLNVDKVTEVDEMWPSYRKDTQWREFRVVVLLKPGSGEYEALLRHDREGWSLLAHIRRLDDYSDQICLHDDFLQLYCKCK